ncbi:response regulator [Mongoliimonas terrestris]|uniref:response regulator n=1 Tax=Mongoliimonas terrestris TaxID=1709001 RepID=UPI00094963B1|nr:response regulator [Mongoliimonas terrestris]
MAAVSYLALDGLRIGLVDDNAYSRRLVRAMLNGFGIRQIVEGATAQDGWDMVVRARPDILLLDWNLPDVDGVALLNRIRTHPSDEIATQYVVFLSAYSGQRQVLTAVRIGANDFIVKPVSPRLLYDRLKRLSTARIGYMRRDGRAVPVLPGQMQVRLPEPPAPARPAPPETGDITYL